MHVVGSYLNDFETAKRLVLTGLLEQVYTPLRDVIECSGVLHVFLAEPKRAERWMRDLTQYQPGDVIAALKAHGISLSAYAAYNSFSYLTHPNVLGSLTVVRHYPAEDGRTVLRAYHYGGYKNEPWMRLELRGILAFFLLALHETFAPVLVTCGVAIDDWPVKIDHLVSVLHELGVDIEGISEPTTNTPSERRAGELVRRRLRMNLSLFNFDEVNGAEELGDR